MFVAKRRLGAGLQYGRGRSIEDTTSAMEGRGPFRPCAAHARGGREAARVEFTREPRANEETLQGSIGASLQGVLQSECAKDNEQAVFPKVRAHTLHMIKVPARDAGGRISELGPIATDVTERKRAEKRRTISLCGDGGRRAR